MTPDGPGALALAAAGAAVLVGSAIQGAVGIGMALLAAPILFVIDPRLVPGPLIFASLVLTGLTAHRDRSGIDFHGIGWGLLGRVPGTLLGAGLLAFLPPDGLEAPLAVLVLVGVGLSVSGLRLDLTRRTLLGAGFLSGFMGTASSIGGPPLALLYQHAPGHRLRGTLAAFFTAGTVMSLAAIAPVGRFGAAELRWGTALIPGAVLGFAISGRLTPWLDRGRTRQAVLTVAAATGTMLLVRSLG